ncbi:MAG TPA: thiamine pyrophosphate-dependent dehydrogenase E1 component subunit alpha [Pirellulales bacterium]|nr:thiamine pyrophosphate-dependent dehydrogenase E1 component subunit alpha [Pirellulales bacterium]
MIERFYRALYRIRRVEEEIARVYPQDKIKSPVHLSIGQEAISVAVCDALAPTDVVFGTYRGHALYLAKGGDLRQMIAELYGKATGCSQGKGGSMHLVDTDAGVMGTSAVVGTTIANAVGYAYAMAYRRSGVIVASFFGDGATEEGVFHESLNFAALKRLPMIFVCENNSYAIHTHQLRRQALANIAERARSYGIRSQRIDDGDVVNLHERVREAVDEIRAGHDGPYFFECKTYRWREHVGPANDWHLGYRQPQEAQSWFENDSLRQLAGQLDEGRRREIETEVECEIEVAFAFAELSAEPKPAALYTDVVKDDGLHLAGQQTRNRNASGQPSRGQTVPKHAAEPHQAPLPLESDLPAAA